MTGYLNAHGTSLGLNGQFVSINMSDDEAREWAGVESLAIYDPFEEDNDHMLDMRESDGDTDLFGISDVDLCTAGRADLMKCPYWDFGVKLEPVQYVDIKEWYYATLPDEEAERLAAEAAAKMAAKQLEEELEAVDRYLPSSSSNRTHMYHINWYGEDSDKGHRARRNVNCRQKAKFRIDGKLARKDNRDHRIGNRQKFAGLRDYWADREMTMWDIYLDGDRDPIIPQFDIEIVVLTDDEASSYEAEYQRDRADYIRELEAAEWDDSFEDNDSLLFKSVTYTDQLVEIHERHLFPERFETYRPYRYSSQDYYDDYGMDLFEPEWDCGPDYDERDDLLDIEEIDFGPTLEEWVELDSIAFEQMLEEEADRFAPSFVGSSRSNLRYHINEPRRGKLKRKYGKSTSFFYRAGRPYTATAATH